MTTLFDLADSVAMFALVAFPLVAAMGAMFQLGRWL